MPQTIRFHLDENCDLRIAAGARRHGIDVSSTPESGLREASDHEQLSFARRENRVIVTRDADFLRLDADGRDHVGIVFYSANRSSIGDVIRSIKLIWELLEPVEMHNRVEYI